MLLPNNLEGNTRQLWCLSFPLMLSSLSFMSMLFVDRLLLAHYSTEGLNAAVNAATLGWAFVFAGLILSSISEVFVAQYNGAHQKYKLGEPVWQMIWMALFLMPLFAFGSLYGSEVIWGKGHSYQKDYFSVMMLFGPCAAFYGALSGFFIGQGKTVLITCLAVATNIVNAMLDYVLIFGIEGWTPSLGVKGASIATGASSLFQVCVLSYVFLNKSNRMQYGTGNFAFKSPLFWSCFKVGVPSAIFSAIEVGGWASFYWMMSLMGKEYITIAGICQSVVILLYFFPEGLSKATSALVGNMIGARQFEKINNVLYSGMWLNLFFLIFLFITFFLFSNLIITQFLPLHSQEELASIQRSLYTCLAIMFVYQFFEGIRFVFSGLLTAAGDTLFLLIFGSLSVWALLVIPVYYFIVHQGGSIEMAECICLSYSLLGSLLYGLRFYSGRWKSLSILPEELPKDLSESLSVE